jgi:hypothetical protein
MYVPHNTLVSRAGGVQTLSLTLTLILLIPSTATVCGCSTHSTPFWVLHSTQWVLSLTYIEPVVPCSTYSTVVCSTRGYYTLYSTRSTLQRYSTHGYYI